jgi:hypothetical protein
MAWSQASAYAHIINSSFKNAVGREVKIMLHRTNVLNQDLFQKCVKRGLNKIDMNNLNISEN